MTRMARGHGWGYEGCGVGLAGGWKEVQSAGEGRAGRAGGGRGNELLMARITRARTCLSHRGVAQRGSKGQPGRAGRGEIRYTNGPQQTFDSTSSLCCPT